MSTEILNYNNDRKCNQKYCDRNYEFFVEFNILGMIFQLPLCAAHALEFDNKYFKLEQEALR